MLHSRWSLHAAQISVCIRRCGNTRYGPVGCAIRGGKHSGILHAQQTDLTIRQPLYLQVAKDRSPLQSGAGFLSWTCTVGSFALATALLLYRSSRYNLATLLGWFITTLGTALLVLLNRSSTDAKWAGLLIVSGIGLGILAPALFRAAIAPATNEQLSTATGLYSFFHCLGRAFGIAISGTIFQNRLLLNFLKHPNLQRPAVGFTRDAVALVQAIQNMPGDRTSLKFILKDSYVDAIRFVWIVLAAVSGAVLVLGLAGIRALPAQPRNDDTNPTHEMKATDEER